MKRISFFIKNRFKNPFRSALKQYVRLKKKYLQLNKIELFNYLDDDFNIAYYKGGKGPALLFIHGFALDALMNWSDQLVPFSKNFTVIAPDLVWFGKSESKLQPELQTQRIAIERLLRHLNLTEINVVGQSYGGFVAIDLALKNPGLVNKLCISNSPGTTFNDDTFKELLTKLDLSTISELFVMKNGYDVRRLLYVASYKKPFIPIFVLSQAYDHYFSKYQFEWKQLLDTLPDERTKIDNLEELKKCKTIMLWGEFDELFLQSEGEKFAKLINCKFVVIPKTGHAPQIDDSRKFNSALKDFFN